MEQLSGHEGDHSHSVGDEEADGGGVAAEPAGEEHHRPQTEVAVGGVQGGRRKRGGVRAVISRAVAPRASKQAI